MGQPIVVTEKPTGQPGIVRFELNRSLTGMSHERYHSVDDTTRDRPPDRLARLLFQRGGVRSVHIMSNEVTVGLEPGASTDGIAQVMHDLYIHYREGVTPSVP